MKLSYCLKTLTFLLTSTLLTGCFYAPYFKDDNWVYFDEWDTDDNSRIDSTEFVAGYRRDFSDEADVAQKMFGTCDRDKDGVIRSLEFYQWQLDRSDTDRKTAGTDSTLTHL